jgi:imidazolonepropionase-like amidohydrolase
MPLASFETPQWGYNGAEIGYLVEAGLPPLAAIEAATANGPETLGR